MADYSKIGPYTTGYWLIEKGGQIVVVDRAHLPAEGQGLQYYWVGDTPARWEALFGRGITSLGGDGPAVIGNGSPHNLYGWLPTLKGKGVAQVEDYSGMGVLDDFLYGAAGGLALKLASGVRSAIAGAGASGAAKSGAGGAAGGAASKLGDAATKTLAAASITGLFTQIGLWKGVGMVIGGAILILIGILNLAGVDPGTAKRALT